MLNNTTDIFFSLIRLGLGISLSLSFKEITDKEWSEIVNMAHKQTMLGIVMDAIDRLPDDVSRPPKAISMKLLKMGVNMERYNKIINLKAAEMTSFFNNKGMDAVLLKGQGLAALYPNSLSFLTRNARNLKLIKEYPEEVLWRPAFKFWHFFWRMINKTKS